MIISAVLTSSKPRSQFELGRDAYGSHALEVHRLANFVEAIQYNYVASDEITTKSV